MKFKNNPTNNAKKKKKKKKIEIEITWCSVKSRK